VAIEDATAGSVSFAGLHHQATRLAVEIQSACIPTRDRRPRVGIVLPNGPETAVTLLGTAIAGTAIPFNPSYLASEFEAYFRETRLDALVLGPTETGPCLGAARALGIRVLRLTEDGPSLGLSTEACTLSPPNPDDVALVLLTSGSTGRAKCVPLTHENVCTSARDICQSMQLTEKDRCLAMWEQYHVGGLVDLLLAPLASGGAVICTGGFNAREFYRLLVDSNPTWFQCVPTTLSELLFHAGRHQLDPTPNALRLIRSVAASLPPSIKEQAESLFSVPVIQTFGMTEAGPLITSTRLGPPVGKPKSVGFSCGPEIRILGPTGETLSTNEIGEIAIRGPNVFSGYENDPVANQHSFRDGWFLTGDIGFLDHDAELFLTGRTKHMINRGGEKVNPQEIDDALMLHPAVAAAAAFPIKHNRLGEDVAAAVVLDAPVDVETLRRYLTSHLAPFKIPAHIEIVSELPRTSVGKIDRLALAQNRETMDPAISRVAAPVHEMEMTIARVWATELDLEDVSIHDGFAALGGDSLSSVRVLVALENVLGRRIPDTVLNPSTTVAQLAQRLDAIALDQNQHPQRHRKAPEAQQDRLGDGHEPNNLIDLDPLAYDNVHQIYARWKSCQTVRELNIWSDHLTLYTTPAELRTLLLQLGSERHFWPRLQPSGIRGGLRLWWPRWKWRRKLDAALRKMPAMLDWERIRITPGALLYQCANVTNHPKDLIVAFGGMSRRLMVPTYNILGNLDAEKFDLLFLIDNHRCHYERGIDGMGGNIKDVAASIGSFVLRHKYREVIALGTSSGGLPAVYVGLANRWSRVVTIGADNLGFERHRRTSAMLQDLSTVPAVGTTTIRACYGAENRRDRDAAAALARMFPEVILVEEPKCTSHNLLWYMYKRSKLRSFLDEQLTGV
jgi:acyl-CoA synthetase (AMP-forming)/AMP-acid ligase II/acyl carrier protein